MTKEAKHTPGPWHYDGKMITADGERPLWRLDVPQEEREANARLIAAGPELLDTAACAFAFIERHKSALIGSECTAEEYQEAMKPLVAAIAKAIAA